MNNQNYNQQPQGQPMQQNQQQQPQKHYVGGGTAVQTQYGELLKVSFNASDLQLMQSMLNEKGWINLNVNRRQQPSQYGQTHSVQIDTWQPNQQAQSQGQNTSSQQYQQPQQQPAPQMQQPQFQQPAPQQQPQPGYQDNGQATF